MQTFFDIFWVIGVNVLLGNSDWFSDYAMCFVVFIQGIC